MAENSKSSMMKLNEENYGDWSMMMEAVLVRKQLWDIVNGEKTRPMGSENSAPVKRSKLKLGPNLFWQLKACNCRIYAIRTLQRSGKKYP